MAFLPVKKAPEQITRGVGPSIFPRIVKEGEDLETFDPSTKKPNEGEHLKWYETLTADKFCDPEHLTGTENQRKGKAIIENTEKLLGVYGVECKYNDLSREAEINFPTDCRLKISEGDRADEVKMTYLESLSDRCNISSSKTQSHVFAIANKCTYNPVIDWIDSQEWDGIDRVSTFIDIFETTESMINHRNAVMLRWLFAGYHMITNTSELQRNQRNVLTLKGAQMAGKTKIMKKLLGEVNKYLLEGQTIDPNNKDIKEVVAKNWLVEIGEIGSTMRKTDMDALKAFITMDGDTFRPAYGRKSVKFARKSFFYATVNDDDFLNDMTGNTRFQVVEITGLKPYPLDLSAQQIWAQIKHMYNEEVRKGNAIPCELSSNEMAFSESVNETYRIKGDVESLLKHWKDDSTMKYQEEDLKPIELMPILEIFRVKSNSRAIGNALKKIGYKRTSKNQPYINVRIPQHCITMFKRQS